MLITIDEPTLTCHYHPKGDLSFHFLNFENGKFLIFISFNQFILLWILMPNLMDFPGGSDGKASAYNARDLGLIPGSGISSGEGNGNPVQYSCLENPMDGGAWYLTVHGVAKSQTLLSDFTSLHILTTDEYTTLTVLLT